uniref:Uncharacterized protein LOC105650696 n=1 Tax=Rhizophora mucronata TaxID=61149 RepID=A0A2P2JA24_RHIMU
MIQPVEVRRALSIAIIAQYILTTVPVLLWKLLSGQQCIKHAKVNRHISHGFAAYWTGIVAASVCLEASRMHIMAAR